MSKMRIQLRSQSTFSTGITMFLFAFFVIMTFMFVFLPEASAQDWYAYNYKVAIYGRWGSGNVSLKPMHVKANIIHKTKSGNYSYAAYTLIPNIYQSFQIRYPLQVPFSEMNPNPDAKMVLYFPVNGGFEMPGNANAFRDARGYIYIDKIPPTPTYEGKYGYESNYEYVDFIFSPDHRIKIKWPGKAINPIDWLVKEWDVYLLQVEIPTPGSTTNKWLENYHTILSIPSYAFVVEGGKTSKHPDIQHVDLEPVYFKAPIEVVGGKRVTQEKLLYQTFLAVERNRLQEVSCGIYKKKWGAVGGARWDFRIPEKQQLKVASQGIQSVDWEKRFSTIVVPVPPVYTIPARLSFKVISQDADVKLSVRATRRPDGKVVKGQEVSATYDTSSSLQRASGWDIGDWYHKLLNDDAGYVNVNVVNEKRVYLELDDVFSAKYDLSIFVNYKNSSYPLIGMGSQSPISKVISDAHGKAEGGTWVPKVWTTNATDLFTYTVGENPNYPHYEIYFDASKLVTTTGRQTEAAVAAVVSQPECKLEYERADNMWPGEGQPSPSLGKEYLTISAGQTKDFVTDWAYEKKRNDGSKFYGSHLRRVKNAGNRNIRLLIRPAPFVENWVVLSAGQTSNFKADLVKVECPQ